MPKTEFKISVAKSDDPAMYVFTVLLTTSNGEIQYQGAKLNGLLSSVKDDIKYIVEKQGQILIPLIQHIDYYLADYSGEYVETNYDERRTLLK